MSKCPFTGCALEKTGGCEPSYREICKHHAEEMKMDISQLHAALRRGVVHVVFTKANGQERAMKATLNDAFLPEENRGRSTLTETDSTAISVWDVEAKGWRAFRLDSLKEINGISVSSSVSMLSE
jgi:hypothetical protein